jgi:initiation factor 1A
MTVKCADGKRRMARIAGKLRSIWVREGDYVLLKPQMLEGDKKADITWRYRYVELDNLRRRGILKDF